MRRLILILAAVVIAIMTLYPPWITKAGRTVGYRLIFGQTGEYAHVNLSLLLIQIIATALIAGFLSLATKH